MVSSARAVVRVVVLASAAFGCAREPPREKPPRPRPIEASPFVCSSDSCLQRHVRLPDDGEWRCAEQAGVVWCAGGESAAGVVRASASRGYRCGARRGAAPAERVCVDPAPDYPPGGPSEFRCHFEEERGVTRACSRRKPKDARENVPRPSPAAEPNCWVDADCSGHCDRGSCREGS